jgi:hypothetical protein
VLSGIRSIGGTLQFWNPFDEYTRDPHSEGDSGVFQKMVDWILSKAK